MLKIVVPLSKDLYDEAKQEFIDSEELTLLFEHSLASISKWESREEKAFLDKREKSGEELLRYIHDMCLTPDVSWETFLILSVENIKAINDYINAKMTATRIHRIENRPSREVITAEIVYYWMVSLQIPFECQHWHLNRLLMLVQVCNEKNRPSSNRKMSKGDAARQRRELNAQRKAAYGTRG